MNWDKLGLGGLVIASCKGQKTISKRVYEATDAVLQLVWACYKSPFPDQWPIKDEELVREKA